MELELRDIGGDKVAGSLSISDAVLGADYNQALVHQVVVAYMAGARQGSKANKSRAMVRGGGAKPWRQKGMGRARSGTSSSPIWRGGGVTFAATPRDHSRKVNRKMYRAAMRSMLSELLRSERLHVLDSLKIDEPKTKALAGQLSEFVGSRLLIIVDQVDDNLYLAARNIPNVIVGDVASVDPLSLISAGNVLMTQGALKKLEEKLVE